MNDCYTHAFSTNHVFLREKIVTAQGPHYCWAEVGLLATYMASRTPPWEGPCDRWVVDESPASPGGFLYQPPEGRIKGALEGEGELQAPRMVSTLCLGGDEICLL